MLLPNLNPTKTNETLPISFVMPLSHREREITRSVLTFPPQKQVPLENARPLYQPPSPPHPPTPTTPRRSRRQTRNPTTPSPPSCPPSHFPEANSRASSVPRPPPHPSSSSPAFHPPASPP